jgi:hypothetical protein
MVMPTSDVAVLTRAEFRAVVVTASTGSIFSIEVGA